MTSATPADVYRRIDLRMADVDTSDPDACWEWPGAKQPGGYGHVSRGRRGIGSVRVSRAVLERELGRPILPGLFALHRCDNPPCVNPAHLREGTRRDNVDEAVERGRFVAGEQHPASKLTDDDVRMIRRSGASTTEVARELGVSHSLVSMIRSGKRWTHLALTDEGG